VIAVNFTRKMVLIGGTAYAGEIKKSVFTILNYLLPPKRVMPCIVRPMSADTVTRQFSSASREPARPRSPPTRAER